MIYLRKFSAPEGAGGKEKYRSEHEAGLLLLWDALKLEYGLELADPEKEIKRDKRGKPFLAAYPQVFFNISHSGNMAVCALGNAELGVDVEKIRPARLHATRRILTDRERGWLEGCPENMRDLEFFRIWTLKESCAKATGAGLAMDFTGVECSFPSGSVCVSFLKPAAGGQEAAKAPSWRFSQKLWDNEYVISYCGQEEKPEFLML